LAPAKKPVHKKAGSIHAIIKQNVLAIQPNKQLEKVGNPEVWENLYKERINKQKRHGLLVQRHEAVQAKKQEKEEKECTF